MVKFLNGGFSGCWLIKMQCRFVNEHKIRSIPLLLPSVPAFLYFFIPCRSNTPFYFECIVITISCRNSKTFKKIKIRHCFFGAYQGKIANCISASASVFVEATPRLVRLRSLSYDGTRQHNILRRQLNRTNNYPDNESRLYCQH